MKRPAIEGTRQVKRTLWRNTLMGIIGLTMSACGISADEPLENEATQGIDVLSALTDTAEPSPSDKQKEIDSLKRELEVLRKRVADVEAIEPPTLNAKEKPKTEEAIALTTEPKPGALNPHEVEGELGIVASAMALGVEKRVPLGVGSKFSTEAEKIWAFIKVKNKKAPTKLKMVWKRNGKQRMAIDLRVGKSSGWRTWSYKRIGKRDAGNWTVDVLTQEGEKLHTMAFELTDGQAHTDLANN